MSRLLAAERRRRGTRKGSRVLTCFRQAVLGLRWFRQDADITALGRDHGTSRATAYRYVDEVTGVLADQAPDLHEALERAKADGLAYVILDGKIFSADRCSEKTTSVKGTQIDLWYSGKAHEHDGSSPACTSSIAVTGWMRSARNRLARSSRSASCHRSVGLSVGNRRASSQINR